MTAYVCRKISLFLTMAGHHHFFIKMTTTAFGDGQLRNLLRYYLTSATPARMEEHLRPFSMIEGMIEGIF